MSTVLPCPRPTKDCDIEARNAMLDVYSTICEMGKSVTFVYSLDLKVDRDRYQSIKQWPIENVFEVYAYPINFTPNEESVRKAGLFEIDDGLLWTAALPWVEKQILFDDIDLLRWGILIDGNFHLIRSKAVVGQYRNSWLYYTFGFSRL